MDWPFWHRTSLAAAPHAVAGVCCMKSLFSIAVLGLMGAALVGCEASAEIGDPDDDVSRVEVRDRDGETRTTKKTTTIEADGDTSTKTEVKVDR